MVRVITPIVIIFLTLASYKIESQISIDDSNLIDERVKKAFIEIQAVIDDPTKLKTYCGAISLYVRSSELEDSNKAEELALRADKMTNSLGEGFSDAIDLIDTSEDNPIDRKRVSALYDLIDELDQKCQDDQ